MNPNTTNYMNQKQEEEMAECTFTPKISKYKTQTNRFGFNQKSQRKAENPFVAKPRDAKHHPLTFEPVEIDPFGQTMEQVNLYEEVILTRETETDNSRTLGMPLSILNEKPGVQSQAVLQPSNSLQAAQTRNKERSSSPRRDRGSRRQGSPSDLRSSYVESEQIPNHELPSAAPQE